MDEKGKRIVINNAGEFAGNVDSPGGVVNVGKMQQDIEVAASKLADRFREDPSVQAIISDANVDAPAKTTRLAQRLGKLAGVGLDVALVAAQQLLRTHTG